MEPKGLAVRRCAHIILNILMISYFGVFPINSKGAMEHTFVVNSKYFFKLTDTDRQYVVKIELLDKVKNHRQSSSIDLNRPKQQFFLLL